MAKYSKNRVVSQSTKDEGMNIARGTQRPGQSKEQTKLIAQGIQKGIDQYKKQQKAKARDLDKKLKKTTHFQTSTENLVINSKDAIQYKQHWLPWVLLLLSWFGIVAYIILYRE
ncbi:MAG: DUF2956 domain-containing protein [Gammaproteobacteria bacterium]|nr:DUF2956 domain-containing protein [Gammaproteobacteria bacterium]